MFQAIESSVLTKRRRLLDVLFIPRLHDTTGWLYHVNKHPTGCQTGLTTGCMV